MNNRTIHELDEIIQRNPEDAMAYNNRGYAYSEKGDYDKAIEDLNKALEINPEYTVAYNNRGRACFEKKEFDRAIENFNKAIHLNPQDAETYVSRGDVYGEISKYDKAIEDYDKAIHLNPQDAIAYHNRGYTYHKKGEYDRAIIDYNQAIKLDPECAITYLGRGNTYFQKGNSDMARADQAKAIRLNPEDTITYLNRGSTYSAYAITETYREFKDRINASIEEEERSKEIATYDEIIRFDPENSDIYKNRGDIYFKKGAWNRAISDYTEYIKLVLGDATVYNSRGDAYYEKGNYDEAIKDYDEVIRLTPEDDSSDFREKRGNAYYQKGDYDKAIEAYNEAIYVNPGDAISAYAKRGDAYSKKLNIVQKSEVYNDAIRANLEVATTYHNKGYAYYRAGKYELAIVNYNEAIRLDPENVKVYIDRGDDYSKKCDIDLDVADYAEVIRVKNDIDLAIVDYNEAIRRDLGNFVAYFNRGHAYLKKSDIELAAAYNDIITINELNAAIRRNPKDAAAYFSRGYMYSKQGNVDQAIKDYENVVLCPNYRADFVAAGFADGGEYAFGKAIELLDSVISSPSAENAADFYYLGVQALFRLDRLNANECFAEVLALGYHDRSKVEKHLENINIVYNQVYNRRYGSGRGSIRMRRSIILNYRERSRMSEKEKVLAGDMRVITPKRPQWQKDQWKMAAQEERHNYRLAIANYNETIRYYPEEASAYSGRGYAYFQRGEYDLAIVDYNKVIQLNPKDVTAYFNKSSAYQQKGCTDLHIASCAGTKLDIALLDEAIRFNPKNAENYVKRGIAYFKKGKYKIITDCDDYDRQGDYESAIVDYNEALSLNPEDTMVYYQRAITYQAIANVHYEFAQCDEAVEVYSKAIRDFNEVEWKGFSDVHMRDLLLGTLRSSYTSSVLNTYLYRGETYAKKANYDLAIADMNEVILNDRDMKKTPKNYFGSSPAAAAYNNRGFYHYKKGEYDKAIEDLREALNIYLEHQVQLRSTPDFAIIYLNLGSVYQAKMDYDMAIENYDNVVRICPNYVEDFVNSKFANGGQEEVHKAVKLLESVVDNSTHPESFAAYCSGVSILFSGNRHKARRRFERARELGFKDDNKIAEHLENLKS